MKKSLIILSLIISVLPVFAQDSGWGLRAAFDINIPGKIGGIADTEAGNLLKERYRQGYGGTIGVVYDHWINGSIFLEPGVSLFYDSYSYKDLIIMEDEAGKGEKDPSLYKLGVRVPVVVGYSYDLMDALPMRVYTGPELSYAFAGDIRFKNRDLVGDWHLFGKNGEQRRFDVAWKLGLGADFDLATVSVEATLGLTDLCPGKLSFRENRVSVVVTHFF